MKINKPLVSIGLPVYNGEAFLDSTLRSLRAQTYKNFELIISDNASTDQTSDVCKRHAHEDIRIRYYRNFENIGMISNMNRLLSLAQGKYFMFAGSHDLWQPDSIATLAAELEKNPNRAISFGEFHEIDDQDRFVKIIPVDVDTQGLKPHERFRQVLSSLGSCYSICGLMRLDFAKKTDGLPDTIGTDFLFLAQLSLLGEFAFVPSVKTYVRVFPARKMTTAENVLRLIGARTAQRMKGKMLLRCPYLLAKLLTLKTALEGNIPFREKLKLVGFILSQGNHEVLKELTIRRLPKRVQSWLKSFSR